MISYKLIVDPRWNSLCPASDLSVLDAGPAVKIQDIPRSNVLDQVGTGLYRHCWGLFLCGENGLVESSEQMGWDALPVSSILN